MRIMVLLVAVLMLAACEVQPPREASCECFTSTGEPTNRCNFQPVAGAPAVFK